MQVYKPKELFDILCDSSDSFNVSIKSLNTNTITQRYNGYFTLFNSNSDLKILPCKIIFRKDTDFYEVSATLSLTSKYDDFTNVYYLNEITDIEYYNFKDIIQFCFGRKEEIKI